MEVSSETTIMVYLDKLLVRETTILYPQTEQFIDIVEGWKSLH